MTTNQSTRPLSDPHTRGLHLGRTALLTLIRLGVLLGASQLLSWATPASADPLGAGLTAFLLTLTITAIWALIDGWRHPLAMSAVAWAATAALFALLDQLSSVLSYPTNEGGWTGLPDYLALARDGFGFMFALVALPAAVGLVIGQVVRLVQSNLNLTN